MTRLHHRWSIRLPTWDYRERGAYFVTICTHERGLLFEDERFANIATRAWLRFVNPNACPALGDFVVMPNHLHGILWLPGPAAVGAQRRRSTVVQPSRLEASCPPGQATSPGAAPLRHEFLPTSVQPGSLGAIIRAYKSFVGNRINRVRGTPGAPVWQRNYYERVIRDERELDAVREYILDNPRKWAEDPNNPAN